jgi:hypothetical protein
MKQYSDTVSVKCVDNDMTVTAEVLDFKPNVLLSLSLDRSIKMILRYNQVSNEYQGELYGRTFVAKGPKETYKR